MCTTRVGGHSLGRGSHVRKGVTRVRGHSCRGPVGTGSVETSESDTSVYSCYVVSVFDGHDSTTIPVLRLVYRGREFVEDQGPQSHESYPFRRPVPTPPESTHFYEVVTPEDTPDSSVARGVRPSRLDHSSNVSRSPCPATTSTTTTLLRTRTSRTEGAGRPSSLKTGRWSGGGRRQTLLLDWDSDDRVRVKHRR